MGCRNSALTDLRENKPLQVSVLLIVELVQVKDMGYEPIVVLSQADRECADCVNNTLDEYRGLSELKAKVRALAVADVTVCHTLDSTFQVCI